jgi:cell wall-associated NlpC family hydrolase
MELTEEQVEKVIDIAFSQLGSYRPGKQCLGFVRDVYQEIGINIPPIWGHSNPPDGINLKKEELETFPPGRILFLRNKTTTSGRVWTHVALTLPGLKVIHHSIKLHGGTVVVSDLEQVFQYYDFVES